MKHFLLFFTFVLSSYYAGAQNPIVTENLLPGNAPSEWDIPGKGAGDLTIQGFASDISVNRGNTVQFKINTPSTAFTAKIYRLGYYNGNGARFIANATITASLPQAQPACITNTTTGLVDCGNWNNTAQWAIPGTAVSGIYILRLQRTDIVTTNCSHIVFIVRNDASTSDIYFKTSDGTWQAYNGYGGYSLYTGTTAFPQGRAVKVSYNRPFTTRGGGGGSAYENFVFNAEYPMVRWLERNGYDVSYYTDVDADRFGALIQNHNVAISVGHDEYWSSGQRTNIENARNAGVHLAFFSGNEAYWKTRYENSVDGNNTPYKTLVCYKEGVGTMGENICIGKCDPIATSWTGLWRDGCNFTPATDGCKPENSVTGQMSVLTESAPLLVPYEYRNLRFWRNTTIPALTSGQIRQLPYGTLGYEFDVEQFPETYPAGRFTMSSTTVSGRTHKLAMYKTQNGANSAWVFGAGTIQWSWGLDDIHDGLNNLPPSQDMQQATVNLFADMGVQPETIQAGLTPATASTDVTAPVSTITSPAGGTNAIVGSTVTITGTATDANSVGGVEISTDGGTTWKAAYGTTNWSFSFNAPSTAGSITIKSRGIDDSGNMEAAGASGPNVITLNIVTRPNPENGTGGTQLPILVIYKTGNGFNRFAAEMLRAEGFNEFDVREINTVTTPILNTYDVVILGEMNISNADATMFTTWVNAGGTLITFRPDNKLYTLLGITAPGGTLTDKYLLVGNTGAGSGIVNQTIQFHGTATNYSLSGATSLATLYSDASTPTTNPAVTTRNVGSNGGKAIAFAFDLARSVIYTRQGNPAWQGQDRDASGGLIRANDLFFGNAAGDPQPDWIDFNKISIPQADEQMHLLSNIIIQGNLHRKPLPRFWILPGASKAAVVLTGNGHSNGGAADRFEHHIFKSHPKNAYNSPSDVADWKTIRSSAYVYPNAPFNNAQALSFQAEGFEFGFSLDNGCTNFTPASLGTAFTTQLGQWSAKFPGITPVTQRAECNVWSDWATMAKVQATNGIHLDMNYFYWPDSWILDRPGMFTGSGLPMRFGDIDGSLIDCYQVPTQITEEANPTVPTHIASLLDKAIGSEGYYAVVGVNMLNDFPASVGADSIIAAAVRRNVPVVSAKQMLTWLDGRNNSSFRNLNWASNTLTFDLVTNASARNIKAMLPAQVAANIRLQSITKSGNPVSYYFETIKGVEYAFFDVSSGSFTAIYDIFTCTTPTSTLIATPASVCNGGNAVSLTLNGPTGTGPYTVTVNGQTYNNVTAGVPFKVITPNENSIWNNSVVGAGPENILTVGIELGVKFRAAADGYITGIRFYKLLNNTGTHTGRLWSAAGVLLGTVTFTGESLEGWQTAKFSSPIFVLANTTYVASYHAPYGQYSFSPNTFQSTGITNGNLTLLQSGVDGPNGVFKYGNGGVYPDDAFADANYWVDVTYVPYSGSTQNINYVLSNMKDLNNCTNAGPTISTATVTVVPLPCFSLPIELLDFNASVISRKVVLRWTTQTEINNAGFEVQRSIDGRKWQAIGFVDGAGNSTSRKDYQFIDANVTNGKYLYRLKQVDLDNRFNFSRMLPITINGNLQFELGQSFPNPTSGLTTLTYSLPEKTHVFIAVYDINGRVMQVWADKTQDAGSYLINTNVSNLPKGEYFYRMRAGNFTSVKKLVIQ